MKFLSVDQLELLTGFLTGREVGDRILNGRIEAFSCKRAGEDKKLSKVLEQQYVDELASGPSSLGSSPLGPLSDSSTRRLLIDLISTMNASFPDHDFSALRPEQFCRELHVNQVMTSVNRHLAPLSETYNSSFLDDLWLSIEDVVKLRECEVYSYVPDMEDDPFSQGNLWSFNYFFFNRALKRIIYFTCIARSKLMPSSPVGGNGGGGGNIETDADEDIGDDKDDDFLGDWEDET